MLPKAGVWRQIISSPAIQPDAILRKRRSSVVSKRAHVAARAITIIEGRVRIAGIAAGFSAVCCFEIEQTMPIRVCGVSQPKVIFDHAQK